MPELSTEFAACAVDWTSDLAVSIHSDPQHYTDADLERIVSVGQQLAATAEAELSKRREV